MATIDSFFPSRFLKASDLQGRPVKVTIAQVKVEQIGREGERKPVVYFRNTEKGLALNKINAETIAEIAGSVDTEDWQGRQIVLIPAKTDFQGRRVDCIRIQAPVAAGAAGPQIIPQPASRPISTVAPMEEDDIPF